MIGGIAMSGRHGSRKLLVLYHVVGGLVGSLLLGTTAGLAGAVASMLLDRTVLRWMLAAALVALAACDVFGLSGVSRLVTRQTPRQWDCILGTRAPCVHGAQTLAWDSQRVLAVGRRSPWSPYQRYLPTIGSVWASAVRLGWPAQQALVLRPPARPSRAMSVNGWALPREAHSVDPGLCSALSRRRSQCHSPHSKEGRKRNASLHLH